MRIVMLAAVCVRGQLLAPVLEPAHRMAAPHGEPAQANFLAGQDRLVAEAAAHVGRDHANLDFGQPAAPAPARCEPHGETGSRHAGSTGCSRASHCATKPRHSIGDITWRAVRSSRVTFTGAVLRGRLDRAVEADLEVDVALDRVVHQHAAGLLARRACRRPPAAPRIRPRPAAAMSSASARVSATHMAISSPTWRILSVTRGGCSDA